jgi:hypothetical protein
MSENQTVKAAPKFSKLNLRKRLYLQGIVAGKSKRQAALDAGYSDQTALKAKASIETPDLQAAFARLVRQRVPAHKLGQRIAEGLDAMETKFFHNKGVVTDSRDVVNYTERREYAKLAATFGGYASDGDKPSGITAVGVKVTVEHIGTQDQVTAEAKCVVETMG